jgi:hypothetical protein
VAKKRCDDRAVLLCWPQPTTHKPIASTKVYSKSERKKNGVKENRTPDLLLAKQALYQLSYNPESFGIPGILHWSDTRQETKNEFLDFRMVGLGRLELPTPALSERCSNQLSYRPKVNREIGKPRFHPKIQKFV